MSAVTADRFEERGEPGRGQAARQQSTAGPQPWRSGGEAGPLSALRRLREHRPAPLDVGERCEICSAALEAEHAHVVDLDTRTLACSCRACSLLFGPEGAGGGRYRAVPDRYLSLQSLTGRRAPFETLQIPVAVAFFFYNSSLEELVAFYPGPAGATESLLPLGSFEELRAAEPVLNDLVPDVEAVLLRLGAGGETTECLIVPIDVCYALVGLLRRAWRGFDGGSEVRAELAEFFDELGRRADILPARRIERAAT